MDQILMELKPFFELENNNTKNIGPDRILGLKVIDGKKPLDSKGLVDSRLFTGDNHLHAIQDSGLWHLKYEQGNLPPALHGQRWTSFPRLLTAVQKYFRERNIEVNEIVG
jgi:hypothetical protein